MSIGLCHLSTQGWHATLVRLAAVLRPQVETVRVSYKDGTIYIEGCSTSCRVSAGCAPGTIDYMVVDARLGGGSPPPSLAFVDLWADDLREVGRLGKLCQYTLAGVRFYPRAVPCHACDGRGTDREGWGTPCCICDGTKIDPKADEVPYCTLASWKEVK